MVEPKPVCTVSESLKSMMNLKNDYDHSFDFNSDFENVMMFDCCDQGEFQIQIHTMISHDFDNMR